jgi:hypothetical protein
MPAGRAGGYQGVFATGQAGALAVAPLLMIAVVVGWGRAGPAGSCSARSS